MENSRPKEEKITKDIGNLFKWEKETKAFKDRRLGCIKKLFEHEQEEKNYCKPVKMFGVTIILKVFVIVKKHYQLKNILDHI